MPSQLEIQKRSELVVALIGGYGSGKTQGGAYKLLALAAENAGLPGMVVAPTHKMLIRVTLPAFLDAAKHAIKDRNKNEQWVDLVNGSRIWYGSADRPRALEGSNLAYWWLDEGALVSYDAYRILLGRLRLDNARRLQGVITTTPTAGGWLRREFDAEKSERYYKRAPTWENVYNDPRFIDNLLETYSRDEVAAYVEGKWVSLTGLVYPEFSRTKNVVKWTPSPALPVLLGIDFGYRWPSVVYGQQVKQATRAGDKIIPAGSVVIFDEDTVENISTDGLARRIAHRIPYFGDLRLGRIAVDPAGSSHSNAASEQGGISDVNALRHALREEGHVAPEIVYIRGAGSSILRSVNTGLEQVRGMLCNSKGIRTLFYDEKLMHGNKRGVARGKEIYSWRADKQSPLKGDRAEQCDHAQDAERYLVRHLNMQRAGVIRAA